MAVADGVGGWNEVGVDPAKFSKELCENLSEEYKSASLRNWVNLKNIFVEAVKKTKAKGSSTAVMVALD